MSLVRRFPSRTWLSVTVPLVLAGLGCVDLASAQPTDPAGQTVTATPATDGKLAFGTVEIPEKLTVGYAVRLVPLVGDERPDIAIVDSKRILVLENPSWTAHILHEDPSRTDNVCFSWGDVDGDGDLDATIGADWTVDTKAGGSIEWLENPGKPGQAWTRRPLATEPTVHRMNLADDDGDGRPSLFVLPLMGRDSTRPNFAESPVRFLRLEIPEKPADATWTETVVNADLHVSHNFQPIDVTGDGRPEILIVSFEGVSLLVRQNDGAWERTLLNPGEQTTSPSRGASEIRLGRLADGTPFLATIEPWHGDRVAVYLPPSDAAKDDPFGLNKPAAERGVWRRTVIDKKLLWGHAVAVADLDGDGGDELVIGVRDTLDSENPCGVRIYDPIDADAGQWAVTRLDPGGVAVEDLTVGDINGDVRSDIVAVGRATHNVKIYFNQAKPAK